MCMLVCYLVKENEMYIIFFLIIFNCFELFFLKYYLFIFEILFFFFEKKFWKRKEKKILKVFFFLSESCVSVNKESKCVNMRMLSIY